MKSHQLSHKKNPKDIRLFNQNGHGAHYLIEHNCSVDDAKDDFYTIVCTHLVETKALYLENDSTDMICTIFDAKSTKDFLNVFDSFWESLLRKINNKQKWQSPPMFVEAEVHESYYSKIDSDSEHSDHDVSGEDFVVNK